MVSAKPQLNILHALVVVKHISMFKFLHAYVIESNWSYSTETLNLILTNDLTACNSFYIVMRLIKIHALNFYSMVDTFLCEIKHQVLMSFYIRNQ